MKKNGRLIIPCTALRPLINDWIGRWGYTAECRQGDQDLTSGLEALSFQSGVARRILWRIMTKDDETVRFDTADKLLTTMHMVSAWHVELAEYYQEEIEVARYERHLADGVAA